MSNHHVEKVILNVWRPRNVVKTKCVFCLFVWLPQTKCFPFVFISIPSISRNSSIFKLFEIQLIVVIFEWEFLIWLLPSWSCGIFSKSLLIFIWFKLHIIVSLKVSIVKIPISSFLNLTLFPSLICKLINVKISSFCSLCCS